MSLPSVWILILNWNGKQDTLSCLSSLQALTYSNYSLLLIDNGSTDGSTSEIRAQFPHLEIMEMNENLGFAEGNNVGIRWALTQGADYVLLLNNDTVVEPDLIQGFLTSFALPSPEAKVGVVGGKIVLYDQPEMLDHWGGRWNRRTGVFDLVGLREKASLYVEPIFLDYVCGAAFMVKREVFEKIGLLEKKFFVIWEEADFCARARKEGFLCCTAPLAQVRHKVSVSFVGGKPHSTYFWWRNRLLWIARNCPWNHKVGLWTRVLIPSLFDLVKSYVLSHLQMRIYFLCKKTEKRERKKKALQQNRAALCGIKDYLLSSFGSGPSWIYGNPDHIPRK